MNIVAPVTVAALTANVINAAGNWVLVYGTLGFPAMGVIGSAYATIGVRMYLALFLLVVILRRERRQSSWFHDVSFRLDLPRAWQIARLGIPAAVQMTLEVGVFATASVLAGRISPMALAANQIVLNIAGFLFMIPLGLNSAAAVRVGQAVGAGNAPGMRVAGWTALGLAGVFTVVTSAVIALVPGPFLRFFTAEPAVLSVGAVLLLYYAPLPAVRRVSVSGHRRIAWARRNADPDDRQSHRSLADRTAARLLALLSSRLGCRRPLGRADVRTVSDWERRSSSSGTGPADRGNEAMGQWGNGAMGQVGRGFIASFTHCPIATHPVLG